MPVRATLGNYAIFKKNLLLYILRKVSLHILFIWFSSCCRLNSDQAAYGYQYPSNWRSKHFFFALEFNLAVYKNIESTNEILEQYQLLYLKIDCWLLLWVEIKRVKIQSFFSRSQIFTHFMRTPLTLLVGKVFEIRFQWWKFKCSKSLWQEKSQQRTQFVLIMLSFLFDSIIPTELSFSFFFCFSSRSSSLFCIFHWFLFTV